MRRHAALYSDWGLLRWKIGFAVDRWWNSFWRF